MGELVAGIGDEVLLFGAFLVLSFIFVAFLTTRRGRSTQLQAPRQPVHQDDTGPNQNLSSHVLIDA